MPTPSGGVGVNYQSGSCVSSEARPMRELHQPHRNGLDYCSSNGNNDVKGVKALWQAMNQREDCTITSKNMLPWCHILNEIPTELTTERRIYRIRIENTTTVTKMDQNHVCLHYYPPCILSDNTVQCSSGEGEMWEMLVLTNMISLRNKSKSSKSVHSSVNARSPSEKWLLQPS